MKASIDPAPVANVHGSHGSGPAAGAASPANASTLAGEPRVAEPSQAAERGVRGLERGACVGRHVVLEKLGSGGMGVVYAAYDPELDRKVALKLLRPEVGGAAARARLLREAQALGKLSHPNVVGIHDVGTLDDRVWLAMEFVQGQTLGAWMRTPRHWREVLGVMRSAGKGLAAAHAAGLLHRDFKPDNVMVGDDGRVRVMDFGLARTRTEPSLEREPGKPAPAVEILAMTITKAGVIVGTPSYMAPEQFASRELTAAVDQFAFCVTAWEALYGERPFAGSTLVELTTNVLGGRRRSPAKGRVVPGRLRRACERGLSTDPQQRWPSMAALLDELRQIAVPPARRWLTLGVTGGLVALGGGLVVGQYAGTMSRCTGAPAQLEGIWDDARKQEVKAAILSTALVYAPGTWERVESRLDGYAEAWVRAHTDACKATRVTEEQPETVMGLRMACLRERRSALRATVDLLAGADAEVMEEAVELVAGLPSLAGCDDVDRLEQQDERMPPPDDPQVAQEVEALRERLADVAAMRHTGKAAQALPHVESVVEQAVALGYSPLVAEAKLQRGWLLNEHGRYGDAEEDLEEAYALALALEHEEVALVASRLLGSVVGGQQARYAEALVWGQTALPLAERHGDDVEVAASLAMVGTVLEGQGEYEQAERHDLRVLELRERALGGDHPYVAMALNNLGVICFRQGKLDEAERHHRRALEIQEAALGADHPHIAMSAISLGNVFFAREELDEAERHYQHAAGIMEKALGAEHPDLGRTIGNLGAIYETQHELEAAEVHYQRSQQILERALGAEHPDLAIGWANLGGVLFRQGKLEAAKVHYQRALRIREKALGAEHPSLAYALLGLARVALGQQDSEGARAYAERALRICEAGKVAPELSANARYELARALWANPSQRSRARTLAEQARATFAEAGRDRDVAEADAWLTEHPAR